MQIRQTNYDHNILLMSLLYTKSNIYLFKTLCWSCKCIYVVRSFYSKVVTMIDINNWIIVIFMTFVICINMG